MSDQFENMSPYTAPATAEPILNDGTSVYPKASRLIRLVSAIIDGIIMVIVFLPIVFAMGVSDALMSRTMGFGQNLLLSLIGLVIFAAINLNFLIKSGQTIGKKLCKLQIRSESTGELLSVADVYFKRYLAFQLVGQIPLIGSLIGLIDVLMIFRESKKCLHDDIAGSIVVQLPH